jgi:glycosyltransferase involved in cell wall biosynthesis
MAERIIQILSSDETARAMGARGKAIAAERFSSDRHLRNTLELYEELLNEKLPGPLPFRQNVGESV